MTFLKRAVLLLPFAGLIACDEVAVSGDPEALSELRGAKRCVAAVGKETGSQASLNTTEPVVDVNYYIVDVSPDESWTCITDENGQPLQIAKRRV